MNIKKEKYFPSEVANTFLEFAKEQAKPISQMQLQKLMYFAHGWNHVMRGGGLLNVDFQAWKFGPVCPDVYYQTSRFGSNCIPSDFRTFDIDLNEDKKVVTVSNSISRNIDPDAYNLLLAVWNVYSEVDGITLSAWTHCDDSHNPWRIAKQKAENENKKYEVISDEGIALYFQKLSRENRNF